MPAASMDERVRHQITDSHAFQMLASIAAKLKGHYVREGPDDPWAGSPFGWIRALPSRQVGKIGEQLVEGLCKAMGLDVKSSGDSEADLIIAGDGSKSSSPHFGRAAITSSSRSAIKTTSSPSVLVSRPLTYIAG